MKKTLTLLIAILFVSCNQNPKKDAIEKSPKPIVKTENFDWLLGSWKRLKEKEGKETFENWKKIRDTEYAGFGYTMQKGDTIFQEKMTLIKIDGNWDLLVNGHQENTSVRFKGTSHTGKEFVCENHENEFPNKIKYWKNGNKLNAAISSTEMEIPFEFEKLSR